MPIPAEYQRIRDQLYDFLLDARDFAELGSTHQSYTMSQGVFQVFRRRVSIEEAILFSNALRAGIRSLFVADWDVNETQKYFSDTEAMTQEVRTLRENHNFATENAIQAVAHALWKNSEPEKLEKALAQLSKEANDFWNPGVNEINTDPKHKTWELPWHMKW